MNRSAIGSAKDKTGYSLSRFNEDKVVFAFFTH